MAAGRLNQQERYRIHALHGAGLSLRAIADALDRAPSTISRELRRNADLAGYHPERAEQISRNRRQRANRRPRIDALRIRWIERLLRHEWSPDQIAGATALASHEWIYRHIYADQRCGGNLFHSLRRRRKRRRKRGVRDGRGQLKDCVRIHERPAIVETRERPGDWEVDTLHASSGKAVVVTMTERRSRLHLLALAPDRSADSVMRAILGRLGRLRDNVHTLTADNGKEFAEHASIAWALGASFYFADPYAAWQRGSNENANGLTRQYLPRSTDFRTLDDTRLRWIEDRLNNRPRKTLRYRTPRAVFAEGFINPVANRS